MTSKAATFADRLNELLRVKDITKTELARRCDIDRSNITRYCRGEYEAKQDVIYRIAAEMKVSPVWLMGYNVEMSPAPSGDHNFHVADAILAPPQPKAIRVPLLGTIACGDPILAEENFDGEITLPTYVRADFALRCRGDSMINARIFDGDIVYIRQQETVNDGEIAAVLIGDDATLKRVHLYEDHIVLEPENPLYRPIVLWGNDMNTVRILGKAVAFTSIVR